MPDLKVEQPKSLVAIVEDQLIPISDMRSLHARLGGGASLVELSSLYGHDAFLKETDRIDAILKAVIDEPARRAGAASDGTAFDHASRIPNL